MNLDLRTVFWMDAVLYLMLHGAIWFGLARYRSGLVSLWSASGILSAVGLGFLGSRGLAPEWSVVLLGQLFMAAGNLGRQISLRSLTSQPTRRWLWGHGVFNLAYLCLVFVLFLAGASDWLMMLVFYLFYTISCFDYFLIGRQIRQMSTLNGSKAVMTAGLVFSGSLGIKSLALAGGWGAPGLYDMAWDQMVVFIGQFVAISLVSVGFIQIFVDQIQVARVKAELDLVRAQERAVVLGQNADTLEALLLERDEIIRQLTLSNKSAGMGALVASIAHELNQPLTTIVIKSELIENYLRKKEDVPGAVAEAHKLAQLIRDDTRHAAAIIRTLRSMFTTGKGEFARLDLATVVGDVIRIVRARAERSGILLDVRLETPLLMTGDVTQLQQVVLNLLNNAIDVLVEQPACPSRITVTGEVRPGLVEIKIADNGRGIDPTQHDDVFALFKTSKSQGMGVGLWLSQSIVTSHRGQLTLQSTPGQGAVFSLTLPSHEYVVAS